LRLSYQTLTARRTIASPVVDDGAGAVPSNTPPERWKERYMGFLHRHDEPGGTRYQMRERLFAIGDDYWIETDGGERAFKVDGKALRVRETFILETPSGHELFRI
jgi:hypothetical protein